MSNIQFISLITASMARPPILKKFNNCEFLFRRGDQPLNMFYVVSGEARLQRQSNLSGTIIFQRARSSFFAEASFSQVSYHCDGVVDVGTQILSIPMNEFRTALQKQEVRDHWITHLSDELRRTRAHGERLSLHTAQERIIHFIEVEGRNGEYTLSISKKTWAFELGLSHEALYRTLRLMCESGKIEISGKVLRLLSS